jgi:hypothetical protein
LKDRLDSGAAVWAVTADEANSAAPVKAIAMDAFFMEGSCKFQKRRR